MKSHKRSYHHFNEDDVLQIRTKLTDWYNQNRRKLPWRGDPPPYGNESIASKEHAISEPPHKKRKLSKDPKQPSLSLYFKPKSNTNSDSKESNPDSNTESNTESASNPKPNKNHCQPTKVIEIPSNDSSESPIPITAYHIWVSEVMLQQTKVETVIKYYLKWMDHFPTIHKLANATLDEVNAVWAGLGYYRRAKFLHEAASMIIDQFDGKLPKTLRELKSIKGIGDYTAGAVSSIAYNQCNAAVDGNLVRVLSRLRAIAVPGTPPLSIHWDLAQQLVRETDVPGILNQALMELGACICTPKSPKCTLCPVSEHCRALQEVTQRRRPVEGSVESQDTSDCDICGDLNNLIGDIEDLKVEMYPMKRAKTKVREQIVASLILIVGDDKVLMIKRPKTGLLADQWEFPMQILLEREPEKKRNNKQKKRKGKEGGDMKRGELLERLMERMKALGLGEIVNHSIESEYCGSSLHIFSHIRQISHVFRMRVEVSMDEVDSWIEHDGEHQWIAVDSMDNQRITVCVKKQWTLQCNFDNGLRQKLHPKIIGRKRKRKCVE